MIIITIIIFNRFEIIWNYVLWHRRTWTVYIWKLRFLSGVLSGKSEKSLKP